MDYEYFLVYQNRGEIQEISLIVISNLFKSLPTFGIIHRGKRYVVRRS